MTINNNYIIYKNYTIHFNVYIFIYIHANAWDYKLVCNKECVTIINLLLITWPIDSSKRV